MLFNTFLKERVTNPSTKIFVIHKLQVRKWSLLLSMKNSFQHQLIFPQNIASHLHRSVHPAIVDADKSNSHEFRNS